jgi:hypothetical protein
MALWAALEAEHAASEAGREFNRVPRPEPAERWSEESKDAFDSQMVEHDAIAGRLAADKPLYPLARTLHQTSPNPLNARRPDLTSAKAAPMRSS